MSLDESGPSVAICIAGMHRSGTSMVARLLQLCGLHLGPADELTPGDRDNPDGFWEHPTFVALNDEILATLGGGWDAPPQTTNGDAVASPAMLPLEAKAMTLIERFDVRPVWGWKDPRASLTLPFWRRLLPRLRVVVCLRNPLAVAASLWSRATCSEAFSLALWRRYQEAVLDAVPPEARLVTHYDAFFHDGAAELRRLCEWIGLPVTPAALQQLHAAIKPEFRHHRPTTTDLLTAPRAGAVIPLYVRLCHEAGPVCRAALADQPVGPGPEPADIPGIGAAYLGGLLRARVASLEHELAACQRVLATTTAEHAERVAALAAEHEARVTALRAEHDAACTERARLLDERDALASTIADHHRHSAEHLDRLETLTRTLGHAERERLQLRTDLAAAHAELAHLTSGRLWRLMVGVWNVRHAVAPPGSRVERVLRLDRRRA